MELSNILAMSHYSLN